MDISRIARRLAVAIAVTVATAAAAAPAAAAPVSVASGPAITVLECGSLGGGKYFCSVQWSGGTAPFTIRWQKDGVPVVSANDRSFFTQSCIIGRTFNLSVVVADVTGAAAGASQRVQCTAAGTG